VHTQSKDVTLMSGFELSANIEYMFGEAGDDLSDRVRAAAAAGVRKVEMFTTAGRDVPALAQALTDTGVQLWTMLVDPRTRLIDASTHEDFLKLFRQTAADARTLGCPHVVVGSGPAFPGSKRLGQLETVTRAVAAAVPIADEYDVTILLEAVNTRVDHPGVLFSNTSDSLFVARGADSPRVRLLYDLYHSLAEGEDPESVFPPIASLVAHVQVADLPGRGEPGSGTVDWKAQLALLRANGYGGVIGVECHPTQNAAAALAYISELAGEF
jgi:hydroxypyruvate isomerase